MAQQRSTDPQMASTDTGTLRLKRLRAALSATPPPVQALPSTLRSDSKKGKSLNNNNNTATTQHPSPSKKPKKPSKPSRKDPSETHEYKMTVRRLTRANANLAKHLRKAAAHHVPILDFILLHIIENFPSSDVEYLTTQLQNLIDYNKSLLPVQARATEQGPVQDAYPRYSYNLEGRLAIVAEDNAFNRKLLVTLLEGQGLVCCEARDGEEALDLYYAIPDGAISFIFMDIRMPEIDGLEATRQIRAAGRRDSTMVPIIGVSTSDFPEDIKAAREAGVTQYTTKPINIDVLVAIMKDIAKR